MELWTKKRDLLSLYPSVPSSHSVRAAPRLVVSQRLRHSEEQGQTVISSGNGAKTPLRTSIPSEYRLTAHQTTTFHLLCSSACARLVRFCMRLLRRQVQLWSTIHQVSTSPHHHWHCCEVGCGCTSSVKLRAIHRGRLQTECYYS